MSERRPGRWVVLAVMVAVLVGLWLFAAPARAVTFVVDSVLDEVDAFPGDGTCATAGGACTLRAAVQETSALPGADLIDLPAGTYAIAAAGPGDDAGDFDVSGDSLTINGAGSDDTIIDAAGMGRVLDVDVFTASLTLADLTLRNGDATVEAGCTAIPLPAGGGVCGGGSFTRVVVENNLAEWGGGVFGGGNFTDSTIRDNASTFLPGAGIVIVAAASIVAGTTISGNDGGGIWAINPNPGSSGPLYVVNSTISGNIGVGLLSDGGCDGSFCTGTIDIVLNNVTIAENTGGGLFAALTVLPAGTIFQAPVTISNTLLTDNGTFDCSGSLISAGYNVIGTAPCALGGDLTGNQIGVAGLVGPLADNGGPTETHSLDDASPAKNAGNPAAPGSAPACEANDQRGVPRPIGHRCDVGAFESPCGDGIIDAAEGCDDGNGIDGDGCDTNCTLSPVCSGGTTIVKPKIKIARALAPSGDEILVFKGRLSFAPGTPSPFDPAADGAQILVEDLGNGEAALFDLTYLTDPVPGGAGQCGPKDEWKQNAAGTRVKYLNSSGAIDPPGCSSGSANGLRVLRFTDKRTARNEIAFVAKAKNASLASPVGPLRGTIVIGASVAAGSGGACGRHTFAAADCDTNASGTIFKCR